MYQIIVLDVDGSEKLLPLQKKAPEWTQLKELVGGYIETVPHFAFYQTNAGERFPRGYAFCNENGIAEGAKFNPNATKHWKLALAGKRTLAYEPALFGPVVFYAKVPKK
jgi:hypothetical protein